MDFETAFQVVVGHEGGYVNDPRDPGGETKFGISKRAYPDLDIKALTVDDARVVYRRDYWDHCHCDELPARLRLAVFDTAVNMGAGAAVKLLQQAAGVEADGKIGPKTISATSGATVLGELATLRTLRYAALPTFATYGKGWLRRLFDIHRRCVLEA